MHKRTCLALLILGLGCNFSQAAEAERNSTIKDQKQVAVTIYNQDLALIKDSRAVALESGENVLAWRDVSARIRPETGVELRLSTTGLIRSKVHADAETIENLHDGRTRFGEE